MIKRGENDGKIVSVNLALNGQHCFEDFAEDGRAERRKGRRLDKPSVMEQVCCGVELQFWVEM